MRNLTVSPNLRYKEGKKEQLVLARGSKQARRLEPCRKGVTKTTEVRQERGTLSWHGGMQGFVFWNEVARRKR